MNGWATRHEKEKLELNLDAITEHSSIRKPRGCRSRTCYGWLEKVKNIWPVISAKNSTELFPASPAFGMFMNWTVLKGWHIFPATRWTIIMSSEGGQIRSVGLTRKVYSCLVTRAIDNLQVNIARVDRKYRPYYGRRERCCARQWIKAAPEAFRAAQPCFITQRDRKKRRQKQSKKRQSQKPLEKRGKGGVWRQ